MPTAREIEQLRERQTQAKIHTAAVKAFHRYRLRVEKKKQGWIVVHPPTGDSWRVIFSGAESDQIEFEKLR